MSANTISRNGERNSASAKQRFQLTPQEEAEIRYWLENINEMECWIAFEKKYKSIMKRMSIGYTNLHRDDVIDEVLVAVITDVNGYLLKKNNFLSFLNVKIKRVGFQMICDKYGVDPNDYVIYTKVNECCTKYDISCTERNAYKIAGLTGLSISKALIGVSVHKVVTAVSFEDYFAQKNV